MHRKADIFVAAVAIASLPLVMSGCKVGPNYSRPPVQQPPAFKSETPATQPAARLPTDWWRLYQDAELDRLIAMANESNQNLAQAVARVDQARALTRVSASFLLPTITADPSFTREHTSGNTRSPITGHSPPSATFNTWQIPFDLSYEVDVWGRIRRTVESSNAQATATVDDLAVVHLTITTDVATAYYTIRALDAQVQILQETVTAYTEQVRVVSAQLKFGLVGPIDLYQAQAQLEATQAQLRDAQKSRAEQEHALAILCGQPAPSFSIAANPLLVPTPPIVPPGLPGQLLTRRPDVAEAEQNVVSINAQIGVATADFYPVFTLTSTAGFESASIEHLLDWKSKIASITPSVSMPIFEGGRLIANLDAVKAQYRQSLAAYINQVLIAYGDVEDALTDLHALSDEVNRLRAAVTASQNYVNTARAQYKQGLVNYLTVTDAERTLLANQLTLSQDINFQMAASIHVIKALGGGWDANDKGSRQMSLNPPGLTPLASLNPKGEN